MVTGHRRRRRGRRDRRAPAAADVRAVVALRERDRRVRRRRARGKCRLPAAILLTFMREPPGAGKKLMRAGSRRAVPTARGRWSYDSDVMPWSRAQSAAWNRARTERVGQQNPTTWGVKEASMFRWVMQWSVVAVVIVAGGGSSAQSRHPGLTLAVSHDQ